MEGKIKGLIRFINKGFTYPLELEKLKVCGITGYFTDVRVKSLDEGVLVVLNFRHSDDSRVIFESLESFVWVNHSGCLVVSTEDYLSLLNSDMNDAATYKTKSRLCIDVNDHVKFLDDRVVIENPLATICS